MKIILDCPPSQESMIVLESLRKTVAKTLDRKKRLGQYAVVWQDGKPAIIVGDNLSTPEQTDSSRD
jgi:hypothetical protein